MSKRSPYLTRKLFMIAPSSLNTCTCLFSLSKTAKSPECLEAATEKGSKSSFPHEKLSIRWIKEPELGHSSTPDTTAGIGLTSVTVHTEGTQAVRIFRGVSAWSVILKLFMLSLPSENSSSMNFSAKSVLVNEISKGCVNSPFASNIRISKHSLKSFTCSAKASLRSLRSFNSPFCMMPCTVSMHSVAFSHNSMALDCRVSYIPSSWSYRELISSSIFCSCSRAVLTTPSTKDWMRCFISSRFVLLLT